LSSNFQAFPIGLSFCLCHCEPLCGEAIPEL
jgi:hypothetical protein